MLSLLTSKRKIRFLQLFSITSGGTSVIGNTTTNGNTIPALATMTKEDKEGSRKLEGAQFTLEDVTPAPGTSVLGHHGYMKYSSEATSSQPAGWSHVTDATNAILRTDSDGKISFDGLGEGRYKLHETAAPSGYLYGPSFTTDVTITVDHHSRVTSSVSGGAGDLYGDVVAGQPSKRVSGALVGGTAHSFTLKNISNTITYTNVAGLGGGDQSSLPYVAVGDLVHFKITMRIPDKNRYKSFVLLDNPDGYDIHRNSIKFYHRADGQSDNGTQFSLPTCDSAGTSKCPTGVGWGQNDNFGVSEDGFRVQDSQVLANPDDDTVSSSTPRNPDSIISQYSGQTLVITYDAIVTKEQATNQIDSVVWDLNNAGQANSPDSVRNGNTIPANVKMTQVNIVRRRNGEVIELGVSGSQFTLEDIIGGTSHGFMQRSSSGWSHLRAVATTRTVAPRVRMRSSEAAPTLMTDGNGTINLYGLGEGKYKLHLKKAPDGYLSGPDFTTDVIIDVSHNHSRVTSDPSSSPSGRATWVYKGGDAGIPSTRNSSGTLILLALLTHSNS